MRFGKIAYIPGIRERSIFDLHKITRGFTIGSLKNSLFSHNPRNGFIPLFIEKRRKPQISSMSGLELALTRTSVDRPVDRSKCVVDWPVACANFLALCKSCRAGPIDRSTTLALCFLLRAISVDRAVDRSNYCAGQPTGRSTKILS